MKRLFLPLGLLFFIVSVLSAKDFVIEQAQVLKIQDVKAPIMFDSVDNSGAKFQAKSLFSLPSTKQGTLQKLPAVFKSESADGLYAIEAAVENRDFAKARVQVDGASDFAVWVDDKEYTPGSELALRPATHSIKVKLINQADSTDSVSIKLITENPERFTTRTDGRRMFVHEDVMHGKRVGPSFISPNGKWIISTINETKLGGKTESVRLLIDVATGKTLRRIDENAQWMPTSSRYYVTRTNMDLSQSLISIDPLTAEEQVLAESIPEGDFFFSTDEKSLIYALKVEGTKETPNGYLIVQPEDRQPGWRDRYYPAIYSLEDGSYQRLTVNKESVYPAGISDDGTRLLLHSFRSRLEKRPTTLSSLYLLNLPAMELDTLLVDEGFINGSYLSPKGDKVLLQASPEAFGGIGCTTDSTVVPSIIHTGLYLLDVNTKEIKALTRDFDPNVQSITWNSYDGNIYFSAEARDKIQLYSLNPSTGKIKELPIQEEYLRSFDIAAGAPMAVYRGQSASNPDGLYTLDLKKGTSKLISRPSADRFANIDLIKCEDWNFVSSRGDTIYGRYYLPDNFSADKKYPVIVYYYGGCSPTSRTFDSRYPFHAYAALGYVVYVVQPSGATGFGQEFASRHVSSAGRGVAEDIIEGTQKFLEAHPYTDPKKVGCLGASYGGFMTQYLQTVTDIFAAAVAHAGISDHTSYWGEGYWGYSYSEVSMGDNKPWTNPDLYVKQSPLFRADKIHTPLLLVHGDSDHNVPVGESIQLFTALKLLGRTTALVEIPGEDHWILGYDTQKKWQETIFAWFAKYLKDQPEWWQELYPASEEFE